MTADLTVTGELLRSLVSRIENIETEIAELNADKSDIYKEAKGNGFDVKIIRKCIALRKKDAVERDEEETLLDLYMQSLEGGPRVHVHTHVREATPAHNAETGEIHQSAAVLSRGGATGKTSGAAEPATSPVATHSPEEASERWRASTSREPHAMEGPGGDSSERRHTNAPSSSNRDVSADGEPSSIAAPQGQAIHAGTGSETLADREGRSGGTRPISASAETEGDVRPVPTFAPKPDDPFLDRDHEPSSLIRQAVCAKLQIQEDEFDGVRELMIAGKSATAAVYAYRAGA